MICMILSVGSVVLSLGLVIYAVTQGRRMKRRFDSMTRYVNYGDSRLAETLTEMKEALEEKASKQYADILDEVLALKKQAAQLEKGITPDYEQAKAAANAVNDFNRGITAILGFDPAEAMKKNRDSERGGEA